ncbi:MAG: DUF5685 family protein [Eubacteriales bacterium]|nr:DUF5685 family protein [Eubacteriales bacterium]
MFGYIIPNSKAFDEKQKLRYGEYYCGLCSALERPKGRRFRLTLNYDMCFLVMLLSSLQEEDAPVITCNCPKHPIKHKQGLKSNIVDYAADMNILLSYYQRLDSWNDDKNLLSLLSSKHFKEAVAEIKEKYPTQAAAVEKGLKKLASAEKSNELNPDVPANCFGFILGSIFSFGGIEEEKLYMFGEALGRFIYIMDAVCDLKADLSREQYNPMVSIPPSMHENILTALLAQATEIFQKLPIKRDKDIMENILYSGVWLKYEYQKNKGGRK